MSHFLHSFCFKLLWVLAIPSLSFSATFIPASQIASMYSLTESTTPPFPQATLSPSDTDQFLAASWGLSKGRIQNSPEHLAFVDDPFPNSSPSSDAVPNTSTQPVLSVTYPPNSFESTSGGAQFYSLFNGSQPFQSLLLSYEISFSSGFQWVKGGKLPGVRGGPNPDGCSGGNQPNGTDCFSMRLMWRQDGEGEVYAYIPTPDGLCSNSSFICNSDFGTSIERGSFGFQSGIWNRVSLLVQLNNPSDVANGNVALYFNDLLALEANNLQIRASEVIDIGGLYFSTFFGGDDSSWASPTEQQSFFRNIQMWAGTEASNQTGKPVSGSGSSLSTFAPVWITYIFVLTLVCAI